MEADRSDKARCHKSDMHVTGESDRPIVPKKPANNGGVPPPAELVEGRGLTKENAGQSLLDRTQCRNLDGKLFMARSRGLLGVRAASHRSLCVNIRGRSRMREIRSYGSVRGAAGNGGPYRDKMALPQNLWVQDSRMPGAQVRFERNCRARKWRGRGANSTAS